MTDGCSTVSLTAAAVAELAAITPTRPAVRAAQLATMVQLVGQIYDVAGRSVLDVEVTRGVVAQRIRTDFTAYYGTATHIVEHRSDRDGTAGRYTIRVSVNAPRVARQLGLIDRHGQPTRGLPAKVVGGSTAEVEAAWRGAFIVGGNIADPRRGVLEVACPTWETAIALVGAARRLNIAAKVHDGHRGIHVTVRGPDTISTLLHRLGATTTQARFDKLRAHAHNDRAGIRSATFDNANRHRAQISAAITAARVTRAFEILGDTAPEHLAVVGRLRLAHPTLTLDELGRLADPPITKDTTSGRLRRLLDAADTHAARTHIPDTTTAVPADLRDQL